MAKIQRNRTKLVSASFVLAASLVLSACGVAANVDSKSSAPLIPTPPEHVVAGNLPSSFLDGTCEAQCVPFASHQVGEAVVIGYANPTQQSSNAVGFSSWVHTKSAWNLQIGIGSPIKITKRSQMSVSATVFRTGSSGTTPYVLIEGAVSPLVRSASITFKSSDQNVTQIEPSVLNGGYLWFLAPVTPSRTSALITARDRDGHVVANRTCKALANVEVPVPGVGITFSCD